MRNRSEISDIRNISSPRCLYIRMMDDVVKVHVLFDTEAHLITDVGTVVVHPHHSFDPHVVSDEMWVRLMNPLPDHMSLYTCASLYASIQSVLKLQLAISFNVP